SREGAKETERDSVSRSNGQWLKVVRDPQAIVSANRADELRRGRLLASPMNTDEWFQLPG
ncbi:MAG TPA: hypothetical protein PLK78_17325, partial [Verrucomicrobiota bacterium]|nr:hypothetical protein [Verrucomicrobiota bacterium]